MQSGKTKRTNPINYSLLIAHYIAHAFGVRVNWCECCVELA